MRLSGIGTRPKNPTGSPRQQTPESVPNKPRVHPGPPPEQPEWPSSSSCLIIYSPPELNFYFQLDMSDRI